MHYNVILLDCGTSITSPLFPTIAKQVDSLVVVASQDAPGLNGAWSTLSWLQAHGFSRLLPRTVVALNATPRASRWSTLDEVEATFREQISDVVRVPYDAHLAEGGVIDFPTLTKTHAQGRDGSGRRDRTALSGPPAASSALMNWGDSDRWILLLLPGKSASRSSVTAPLPTWPCRPRWRSAN